MVHRFFDTSRDSFQFKLIVVTAFLSAFSLLFMVTNTRKTHSQYQELVQKAVRAKEIKGEIMYLDEVLTLSANMAVNTTNLEWEKRYLANEPLLNTAIKEAMATFPKAYNKDLAEKTDVANQTLIGMESEAFNHLRNGHVEEAQKILSANEYREQKKIYAEGMKLFDERIEEEIKNTMALQEKKKQWQFILYCAIALFMTSTWALVLVQTRRWQVRLRKNNQELVDKSNELIHLNHSLDEKVKTRTKELEQSQAQLIQTQKMETFGNLAGGIAHDLNNQLTPILGYLDLLLAQKNDEDPDKKLLQESNQAAIRCVEVVQRLVNFSKPSTTIKTSVKIERLFAEIKAMLPQALPANIEVRMSCDADLKNVWGNENELQTVLLNLINNARDAMPDGGVLNVEARNVDASKNIKDRSATYVVVNIKDNGVGIPKEIISRVFDPFFSTKGRAKGTGLGLTMVYTIVNSHEGWVDISSEVGKGTVFQIYLKAYQGDAEPENKKVSEKALLPKGSGLILIVDDEKQVRDLVSTYAQRLGYTYLCATNGLEAQQLFTSNDDIVAVVCDMTMPKMTGRDTLKSILKIRPSSKVILMSGYTDEGTKEDLIKLGAKDFLVKPFTISQLAHSLSNVLT